MTRTIHQEMRRKVAQPNPFNEAIPQDSIEQLAAKVDASIAEYSRLVIADASDDELDRWEAIVGRNRSALILARNNCDAPDCDDNCKGWGRCEDTGPAVDEDAYKHAD
ncbi:MAG: hypothetical protein ABFE13_12015 [Phycisphaerales bacterium]